MSIPRPTQRPAALLVASILLALIGCANESVPIEGDADCVAPTAPFNTPNIRTT